MLILLAGLLFEQVSVLSPLLLHASPELLGQVESCEVLVFG